jgi:hypothetical protein
MNKFINKEVWTKYEQEVIDKFYNESMKVTPVVPTDRHPSYLVHRKVIVVLILDPDEPRRVWKKLPVQADRKVELFHIGERKLLQQSTYGFKERDKQFHYPATDFGGFTGYRQPWGVKQEFILGEHVPISKQSRIYRKWLELSGKRRFFGGIKPLFDKWMVSCLDLAEAEGKVARVNFVSLPDMHRVVVTKNDVETAVGAYYTKVYGNNNPSIYARQVNKTKTAMYATITDRYVNGDINILNLKNEYVTYKGFKGKRVPKRTV